MKDELTLLSLKDIKNIKNINEMTDITLLTGGCYYVQNRYVYSIDYLSDSEDKINRFRFGRALYINTYNKSVSFVNCDDNKLGIRPVIKNPYLYDLLLKRKKGDEVEYGSYPQVTVRKEENKTLENKFNSYQNKPVNNNTYILYNGNDYIEYPEYKIDNKLYIRFIPNDEIKKKFNLEDYVWIRVKPIEWIIKDNMLISKFSLLSGIKMMKKNYTYHEDFKDTLLYNYMNKYLINEIFTDTTDLLNYDLVVRLSKEDIYDENPLRFLPVEFLELYKEYYTKNHEKKLTKFKKIFK